MRRRVVVTGIGAVTAYGRGQKALSEGLKSGRSAIKAIDWAGWEEAPVQVAARFEEKMDESGWRNLQMGRVAMNEALVMSGAGEGGGWAGAIGWPGPGEGRNSQDDPGEILAKESGLTGPRLDSLVACAAATQVIGEAFRRVRSGEVDWMVAGGADGRVHPAGLLGYGRLGALARGFRDRPAEACAPFGKGRSGFVVGEGAGFLVLEEKERAEKRGVKIWAEICGAAEGCDAWRVTDPRAEGEEAAACVEACFADAGIGAGEVDAVVAHGTGTPANDVAEAKAFQKVFGSKAPWIHAPKARVGHLSMACGAVESILAVQAIAEDFLPATVGESWENDESCRVRMVRGQGVRGIRTVLKPSFGFGGQNACLLFSRA